MSFAEEQFRAIPNIVSLIGKIYQIIANGVNGIASFEYELSESTTSVPNGAIGKTRP